MTTPRNMSVPFENYLMPKSSRNIAFICRINMREKMRDYLSPRVEQNMVKLDV